MKTIDERIKSIEVLVSPNVPGTEIQRVFKKNNGFEWCLSIGNMHGVKDFYHGDTIEECLTKVEVELLIKDKPKSFINDGWTAEQMKCKHEFHIIRIDGKIHSRACGKCGLEELSNHIY